jgi:hypothetical protein
MILCSSKAISSIKASCLTYTIFVHRNVEFLLQLASTAIRIASKPEILGRAIAEKRTNLSSDNVCSNFHIMHTERDIAVRMSVANVFLVESYLLRVQDPLI